MLSRFHPQPDCPLNRPAGSPRRGSTLTEVLVALMIMSIGLVSVATIFPISALRGMKATQITQSVDLRYNCESMMAVYPNMILDPGHTGSTLSLVNFVVDPLGCAIFNSTSAPAIVASFGNDGSSTTSPNASNVVPRYSYITITGNVANDMAAADKIVTMPDSWILQFEGVGTNPVTFPAAAPGYTQLTVAGLSASGFALPVKPAGFAPQPPPSPNYPVAWAPVSRAVIFSADGLSAQTRQITQFGTPSADMITWTEDLNGNGQVDSGEDVNYSSNTSITIPPAVPDNFPLPSGFVPGKVRIETQDRRYTWLLTVRRDSSGLPGGATVDVVVFFNRKFELADERLYTAVFNSGSQQVTVNYPAGSPPFLQKGGYIFDANNAYWYRMSVVPAETVPGQRIIYIDVPANASNTGLVKQPQAMFHRSIVDVYPLGSK
jgi:prepilin-type N-terminal cleavage/methylation domain-containing protein